MAKNGGNHSIRLWSTAARFHITGLSQGDCVRTRIYLPPTIIHRNIMGSRSRRWNLSVKGELSILLKAHMNARLTVSLVSGSFSIGIEVAKQRTSYSV